MPPPLYLFLLTPPRRYDYKIAREYNWNVKNKASKGYEENYFFIFREGDGVYYNELETRWGPEGAGTPPQKKNNNKGGVLTPPGSPQGAAEQEAGAGGGAVRHQRGAGGETP